jgi:hypothetical protein
MIGILAPANFPTNIFSPLLPIYAYYHIHLNLLKNRYIRNSINNEQYYFEPVLLMKVNNSPQHNNTGPGPGPGNIA